MIIAIDAGDIHMCALTALGGVRCWGSNENGQLGNGSTKHASTPVDVEGLASGLSAISAGGDHTCALTNGGGVKCWGANAWGQLGNDTTTSSSVPVDVAGLSSGIVAIAAGGQHTCALTGAGAVKCWGIGRWGQLGDGRNIDSAVPVGVSGLQGPVTAITAGGSHTCAVNQHVTVMCWGTDAYQPDCGESPCAIDRASVAVEVIGLPSAITAITAGGHHTCALSTTGRVTCWGGAIWNDGYVNGTGNELGIPGDVAGLTSDVVAITAGGQHTCALTTSGGVKCWGINDQGAVGDGTTKWAREPVDVSDLASGVIAVSAGTSHTCALLATGEIKCWGANWRGQLGSGSTGEGSTVPIDVDFSDR